MKKIPELEELKQLYENNAWHDHDQVYTHVMKVVDEVKKMAPDSQVLHWAALLHDIGKPETFKEVDGQTVCLDHEAVGAKKAKKILKRLKFDKKVVDKVVKLISLHGRVLDMEHNRELKQEFPELYQDLMILGLADVLSCQLRTKDPQEFKRRVNFFKLCAAD
ncbi:MAG: HDIG domain-containing metalloprotein [Candidatus Beckwithbacteria bacterium]